MCVCVSRCGMADFCISVSVMKGEGCVGRGGRRAACAPLSVTFQFSSLPAVPIQRHHLL